MSAATIERPALAASGPVPHTTDANAMSQLYDVLHEAWRYDEADETTGDVTNLLRFAFNEADEMMIRPPSAEDAQHTAYRIASLLKAALRVPGDTPSLGRRALIEAASRPLEALTGDPAVMSVATIQSPQAEKAPPLVESTKPTTSEIAEDIELAAGYALTFTHILHDYLCNPVDDIDVNAPISQTQRLFAVTDAMQAQLEIVRRLAEAVRRKGLTP